MGKLSKVVGRSYVVANCDGCEANAEKDFVHCIAADCERLEYPTRTVELTPLGGTFPQTKVEVHEYDSPSFGVWGDPAVILSVELPEGVAVDVWLDKKELLAALGLGDPDRVEVVREHVKLEGRNPADIHCGNTICEVTEKP